MRIFDKTDRKKSVDVDWLLKRIDNLEVAMVKLTEKVDQIDNPPKKVIIRPSQTHVTDAE